tara:strand:+ start:18464 stop:18934 length:471 start_codon:yes stop_codon:yes gene_type:complete
MIKLFTYTTVAVSMFTLSAQAADAPSTMNAWIDQASSAIEEKMEYPKTAALIGETDLHTLVVKVNRHGDILEVTKGDKAQSNYFDMASNKALRYVDLPDLPSSYKKDTLSFVLSLDYSNKDKQSRQQVAKTLSDKQVIALSKNKPTKAKEKSRRGF